MTRSRFLLSLAVFVLCSIPASAQAPFPQEPSPALTVPLLAGKSTNVGSVIVRVEGSDLVVEYALKADWSLNETHLDIQSDWKLIPQNKNNNPTPGQFAQKGQHPPGTRTVSYRRPLAQLHGARLFLAAQADVVHSSGRTEGAWADGTRFNSKGSWATWFTYQPAGQIVLDQGENWLLLDVRGTVTDPPASAAIRAASSTEPGAEFDEQLYILHGEGGITEAPLPSTIQDALLESQTGEADAVYSVSRDIAEGIEASEAAGALTPEIAAIAEPLDSFSSVVAFSSSCATKEKAIRKVFDLGDRGYNKNYDLGGGFKGSFGVAGNVEGAVTGELNLYVKRKKILAWCVPYGVQFKNVHIFGDATANAGVTLSGTIEYKHSFGPVELIKPHLFDVLFFVGPIPVLVGFNLPISAGMDLDAEVTGSLTYNGSQVATGSFDWVCASGGCDGGGEYDSDAADNTQTITGGVSGRVQAEPYVNVGFRAYLYAEWVLYLQVGLKPALAGDLWGYAGNNCGDADLDGTFESVQALTFDLDRRIDLTGGASIFGLNPWQRTLKTGKTSHISFFDLIGSDAMQPELHGPGTGRVGGTSEYLVKIRPCWPYDKEVTYRLNWGDGSAAQELTSAPDAFAHVNHTWTAAGNTTVTATSVKDKHGRALDQSFSRTVQVVSCSPPSISAQPQSATINSGQAANLSVTSDGTAFQWYQGNSGDTSILVAGGTGSSILVNPGSTTSYWVRVFKACGGQTDQTDSSAATVTVNFVCTVDGTPCGGDGDHTCQAGECVCTNCASAVCCGASGNTYCDGQAHFDDNTGYTATCASSLPGCSAANDFDGNNSVFHEGDVLGCAKYNGTFQWYPRRPSPRCQEVSPVCGFICSTHYNDGGGFQCDSNGVWNQNPPLLECYNGTLPEGWSCQDAPVCEAASISSQPHSATITEGQSALLSVGATGTSPLTYQWYQGPVGGTSDPVAGGTGASVVVTPSATTDYWVRVSNACGQANSQSATVTVEAVCIPANVEAQPQSTTIDQGDTAVLSVSASGTSLSYQWYEGTASDTSNPVIGATGDTFFVSPASTTSYWVRVTNDCGLDDSSTATITVNVGCGPDGTPCGGDGHHTCQNNQCVCSDCGSAVCCGTAGNTYCDGQQHFDPNTGYTGACASSLPSCSAANDFDGDNELFHDGDILGCVKYDGVHQWFPRRPSPRCQEVAPVCAYLCAYNYNGGAGFQCEDNGFWSQNPPLPYCYGGTIPASFLCQ